MDIRELEKVVKRVSKPTWIQETFKIQAVDKQLNVYLKSDEGIPRAPTIKNLFNSFKKTSEPYPKIASFYITATLEDKKQTVFLTYVRVAMGNGTATYQIKTIWMTEPTHRFINLTHYKDGDVIIGVAPISSQVAKGYIHAKMDQDGAYCDVLHTPESMDSGEKESILEGAKSLSFDEALIRLEEYDEEELDILRNRIECLSKKQSITRLALAVIDKFKPGKDLAVRHLAESFISALKLIDIENDPEVIHEELDRVGRLLDLFNENT